VKVGDLIRFKQIRAELREYDNHPFRGKVGLIVGFDDGGLSKDSLVEVLFIGFPLSRWVHSKDCEVLDGDR